MAISTDSWKTILSHSDDDASKLVRRCAEEGDLESIRFFAGTGIFESMDEKLRPRYVDALASMFTCSKVDEFRPEMMAILDRCLGQGVSRLSGNRALVNMISLVDQKRPPAPGIVALIDSGIDPLVPAKINGDTAIDAFFERLHVCGYASDYLKHHGLDTLKALLGKSPEDYFAKPHAFKYGGIEPDCYKSLFTVFEKAIALDYRQIIEWSKTIVPAYPQDFKLTMGDHVLDALDSRPIFPQEDPVMVAIRLIAAGAEMRNGRPSWNKVAEEMQLGSDGPHLYFRNRKSLMSDHSIRAEYNRAIFKILGNADVDINQYDAHGHTLLMNAATAGNVELAGELIALGADPTLLSAPKDSLVRNESAVEMLNKSIFACEALGVESFAGIPECRTLLLAATARHAMGDVIAKSVQSARQFSEQV
jgi:hypothetical protein